MNLTRTHTSLSKKRYYDCFNQRPRTELILTSTLGSFDLLRNELVYCFKVISSYKEIYFDTKSLITFKMTLKPYFINNELHKIQVELSF